MLIVCVLVFVQIHVVCFRVVPDPDVVSAIIPYVSGMMAWAEITRLFGLIESTVLSRNNSQTVE